MKVPTPYEVKFWLQRTFGPRLPVIVAVGGVLLIVIVQQSVVAYLNRTPGLPAIEGLPPIEDEAALYIDIEPKHYQKLVTKRDEALKLGILMSSDEDFVPAILRIGDEQVEGEVRLKGDWMDHLKGNKWSFRVELADDSTLFGMNRFSIQSPETRNYIHEWLWHQANARDGLVALRYNFLPVVVNGQKRGIFAMEEFFTGQLIENNKRRAGPIIKFNEDLLWVDRAERREDGTEGTPQFKEYEEETSYTSSAIDGFGMKAMLEDPVLQKQYTTAVHLLESYRTGTLPADKVFDLEKLASFYAIGDLFGAHHKDYWHNLRFYYNPVTSMLEPISFDGIPNTAPISNISGNRAVNRGPFDQRFFLDPEFRLSYNAQLERVSDPAYLDDLLADVNDELQKNVAILQSENKGYKFSADLYRQNQKFIASLLRPEGAVHAYLEGLEDGVLQLDVGNVQSMPLEVIGITHKKSKLLAPAETVILPSKQSQKIVQYERARFVLPTLSFWAPTMEQELVLHYRVLGTKQDLAVAVHPWPLLETDAFESDLLRQEPNAKDFDFLRFDEAVKGIFIASGLHAVEQSLVIPAGYTVYCEPGTILDLKEKSLIVSYSPLECTGTAEDPVVIQSSDETGQGLVVLEAGAQSLLQHVVFRGLRNPSQPNWELTGAVTFYESPVTIEETHFLENECEDGLNLIRSPFTMTHVLFRDTFGDAFDADFSDGLVADSSFQKCGNDCLDVSGADVKIRNVVLSGVGDKGVSGGENSKVEITNLTISDSNIITAAKDLSQVTVKGVKATGSKYGFASFQKKPEFGPANLTVTNATLKDVEIEYILEEGSTMTVNGTKISANETDARALLYVEQ